MYCAHHMYMYTCIIMLGTDLKSQVRFKAVCMASISDIMGC